MAPYLEEPTQVDLDAPLKVAPKLLAPEPEHCPGPESQQAGTADSCAGCPNQKICASAPKGPDPEIPLITARLAAVKHKVLVLSGKGGVGKSTFSSMLAHGFASNPDYTIGLMDTDICGPSIPKMMGVEDETIHMTGDGMEPVWVTDNLGVMSIQFMLPNRDDAVIWRGPKKNGLIKKFLMDVNWGALDFLIVDTPPGTSDEHLSVNSFLKASGVDGAVLVTTPQEVALLDVRKELDFCRKAKIPVLGIVENMSGFVCPGCRHESQIFRASTGGAGRLAADEGIPFLGAVPLDPRIGMACDYGESFLEACPESPACAAIREVRADLSGMCVSSSRLGSLDGGRGGVDYVQKACAEQGPGSKFQAHEFVAPGSIADVTHNLRPPFSVPRTSHGANVPQSGVGEHQGMGNGITAVSSSEGLETIVGPLLNYRRMSGQKSEQPIWHGSVLIVTKPSQHTPSLTLAPAGAVDANEANAQFSRSESRTFGGEKLYEDADKAFWRFMFDLPFQSFESRWQYDIRGLRDINKDMVAKPQHFAVPSIAQSMRIMFHSCNGFSVGTDVDAWSGPALWNDVLRYHNEKPFHVMIGGGDQIYNDGVRVDGPLKAWTAIGNPHKRREYPFGEQMRADCDEYYYNNYVKWYGQKPFSTANGQIPQLNIWDDHDIIDGFGSYTDRFMRCAVFRGIGGVAHKYYMLFQHHLPPPKTTFTTDAPGGGARDNALDPVQLKNTFVMANDHDDPSYLIGGKPGPYVEERSRSLYCQLGKHIAFCGIDARTERTRHQINYPETYKLIFDRLTKEFSENPDIKHLVLLLGVPIAYPRLQWLENIFQSPIVAPIKLLNKRFGFAGGLFNKFDGNIDLLDDLDDHYTARQHKKERRELLHMLQKLSQQHSVRVTILGGDVHLGAIGRFYSNPKLALPAERDFRYMPNIISSAITNKPPPQAVANLLARRNKIHHLDHDTDETLLEIFDRDPGKGDNVKANGNGNGVARSATNGLAANGDGHAPDVGDAKGKVDSKTSAANHATMPSRNYAIIAESNPSPTTRTSSSSASAAPTPIPSALPQAPTSDSAFPPLDRKSNHRKPIHAGEQHAGTAHPAASGLLATGLCGPFGLDVSLRVEISNSDREGHTDGYGFSVPALEVGDGYREFGERW
ncbi:hypothetical protein BDV95DRAFT_672022 [Massariosphaeria phaeospora]|uniref:PhoD-like phosphatase domain-containing protein n=1 Tax=Massariosphaeria phaeospora TaxID=100035 RepID=A0A7C8M255_9PLEO|nr:hypothetical protein BDV95DRAFT_672022 [Massariosphaeria phaeospora]